VNRHARAVAIETGRRDHAGLFIMGVMIGLSRS
jgi:hypothetical protein